MILDEIARAGLYRGLHPLLPQAFDFLAGLTLENLPEGKVPLAGEALFALPFRCEGVAREEAKLEAHRRFADIHYLLEGAEEIGWSPLTCCRQSEGTFDEGNDYILYRDAPAMWARLTPGRFMIVWPNEAHAVRVSTGALVKIVVKLLV